MSHFENLIKGLITCESKHCLNKAGVVLPCACYKLKLENPPLCPSHTRLAVPSRGLGWKRPQRGGKGCPRTASVLGPLDLGQHSLHTQRQTKHRLCTQQKGWQRCDASSKMSSALPFPPQRPRHPRARLRAGCANASQSFAPSLSLRCSQTSKKISKK